VDASLAGVDLCALVDQASTTAIGTQGKGQATASTWRTRATRTRPWPAKAAPRRRTSCRKHWPRSRS